MGGGHFDYDSFRIIEFAEKLELEIEVNDDKSVDEYGDPVGYGLGKETLWRLKRAHRIIELVGELAEHIERLYSGDHGEEIFNALADKILEKVCEKERG